MTPRPTPAEVIESVDDGYWDGIHRGRTLGILAEFQRAGYRIVHLDDYPALVQAYIERGATPKGDDAA